MRVKFLSVKKRDRIGAEYVVEIKDKRKRHQELYFTCFLCSWSGGQKDFSIHMASSSHKLKFIETHFPSTYQTITRLIHNKKQISNQQILSEIVRCVCQEILGCIVFRQSICLTHHEHELAGSKVRDMILQHIEPYNESKAFVAKVNKALINLLKRFDKQIAFKPSEDSKKPGKKGVAATQATQPNNIARRQPKPTAESDIFSAMTLKISQELNLTYENYFRDHMKHPKYIAEWKKFHEETRSNILENPNQLDWEQHFSRRLTEFKHSDFDQRLAELKNELAAGGQSQVTNSSAIKLNDKPEDKEKSPLRKRRRITVTFRERNAAQDGADDDQLRAGASATVQFQSSAKQPCDCDAKDQEESITLDVDEDCVLVEPEIDLIDLSDYDEDDNAYYSKDL